MNAVASSEKDLERQFIEKLCGLKYEYRPDIRDRASLESNFRERFEKLNRVNLTDSEFSRLLEEIITPDVFTAARVLRERNSFTRDDGTPLNYTLVNIKDWCKNRFEVINQLRMNPDYSHHRYDVILLINGVPVVQVELKTLGVNPRRTMEQIVEYKNDPGNGYTKTLLCFMQLFIVTTIQKLGLALDETSTRNKQRKRNDQPIYKELLEPLRDKHMVFIFDECHRSQFGDNHQAIKEFFPKAQLFGFTGTPIFEANASYQQVEGDVAIYRTTEDLFLKQLHAYTITHAIEDGNVLRFHVDYYRPTSPGTPTSSSASRTKKTADEDVGAPRGAKPALTPKLRFPEFREAEGWEQKEVGDVFQVTRGDVLSMTLVRDEKTDAMPYPVYSSQTKHNGLSGYYSGYLFEDAITWTTDGANAGDVNFRTGKFFCTNVCGVLLNSKGFANPCIVALINRVSAKYVSYVGNPKLMNGIMSKIPIPLPSIAEQQKIAECLSSVDELIGAQARKVDALKIHKKGLMQQLFPGAPTSSSAGNKNAGEDASAPSETQPRLRFPEFQNDGEWEPKLLSDVVKRFKTGKLDANAMVENGQYRFYTCAKNYYQIDHYAFEGEALLVAGNGAHLGYIHHYIGRFNAYQRTYVLQKFKANVVFLRCLLDRYLPARIQFEKKDGNTPYIVLSTLTEMPLVIPQNPDEQHRIADCLSSLDDLIAAETQKLDVLKSHKKGLMQQLFPSPEEVEV